MLYTKEKKIKKQTDRRKTGMQEAALRGATTSDGLEMLRLQAEKAWRIWGIERVLD